MGLIPVVGGVELGGAPQIIAFILIADALLALAIVVASRRGRRLTRASLRAQGTGPQPSPDDAQNTGDSR